jgi:hypothetical protein
LYFVDKRDVLGPQPINPSDDPQFEHWEIPIQNWWAQNKQKYPVIPIDNLPIIRIPPQEEEIILE